MIEKIFPVKKRIGVVVAMLNELEPVLKVLKDIKEVSFCDRKFFFNDSVICVVSGIGTISASSATESLICFVGKENLSFVLNFGICGSLKSASYAIGDVLLVKDVVHYDFDLSALGTRKKGQYDVDGPIYLDCNISFFAALKEKFESLKLVRCACGDKFVSSDALRKMITADFDADICEMESFAIVHVAAKHDLTVVLVKAISDDVEENSSAECVKFDESFVSNYVGAVEMILQGLLT